jgi:hypothetical protein
VGAVAALAWVIFLQPDPKVSRSWYVFPVMIWPALVFSVRGASLAVAAVAVMAFGAAVAHTGPFAVIAGIAGPTVLTQQFIAVLAATKLVLAAVADERRGREQLRRSAERLREESEALEVLNRTGAAIAAELDLDSGGAAGHRRRGSRSAARSSGRSSTTSPTRPGTATCCSR